MEYQRQQRPGGLTGDYYGGGQQPYPQQPPEYHQQQHYAPPMSDNKQTFEQTFKIVKPKWNDLWAGILVRFTFYCACRLWKLDSSFKPLLSAFR
jgi:hypothetical protein